MRLYQLGDAIRHIAAAADIELTDAEVSQMIGTHGYSIEEHGMKVREAARAYEDYVVRLAVAIRLRCPATETTAPEASMNESSQRRN